MTKTQLLADLATIYTAVGTPVAQTATGNIQPYIVVVFVTGLSEKNKKPVASQRNILFYVVDEGLGEEAAYYGGTEPINIINTDVSTSSNTLISYIKIFNSAELRQRIVGWVIKAANTVMAEPVETANHSMRLKWAYDAVKEPTKYLNICMWYISLSDDVRVLGNAAQDSDLTWLGYMVTNIATIYGFTN
jgi:hypothetical protein